MNSGLILDLAIIGISLFLGLGGLVSGLIKEGFGLAGILVGVYMSTNYAQSTGELINTYVYANENVTLLTLFGFCINLVVIWSVFIVLGKVVSKLVSLSGLGMVDRIMGFIFSASKIFIVLSIIASCVNAVPFLNTRVKDYFANSNVFPILVDMGNYITNNKTVQEALEKQKEVLEEINKQGE